MLAATKKVAIPLMAAARAAQTRAALATLEDREPDVVAGVKYVQVVEVTTKRMTEAEARQQGAGVITSVTKFAISEAASHFAQTTTIVPASQLAAEVARHDMLKKTKIVKQTNVFNTTQGLEVTEGVLQRAREVIRRSEAAEAEKKARKVAVSTKKSQSEKSSLDNMRLVKTMEARTPNSWKAQTVKLLWSAVAGWGGSRKAGEKKQDAIAKIAQYLAMSTGDERGGGGEGSDDDDDFEQLGADDSRSVDSADSADEDGDEVDSGNNSGAEEEHEEDEQEVGASSSRVRRIDGVNSKRARQPPLGEESDDEGVGRKRMPDDDDDDDDDDDEGAEDE